MIDLTRLNGHRLIINCDLIKSVEATPDTTITLITGERLIVRETSEQLVGLVRTWRSQILSSSGSEAAHALNAKRSHDHAARCEDQEA